MGQNKNHNPNINKHHLLVSTSLKWDRQNNSIFSEDRIGKDLCDLRVGDFFKADGKSTKHSNNYIRFKNFSSKTLFLKILCIYFCLCWVLHSCAGFSLAVLGRGYSLVAVLRLLIAWGEAGSRGWDGWMASSTQWTRVWANSGRQWRTGKPGCRAAVHGFAKSWTRLSYWTTISYF